MEHKNIFLKIISIILLIGGIIYLIIAIGALGADALAKLVPEIGTELGPKAGVLLIAGVLMLIAGIIEIVAGRTGLKASKDPSKAKACVVLGIIMMIPSVVAFALSIVLLTFLVAQSPTPVHSFYYGPAIGSLIIGVALPLLYIFAAKKAKPVA